MWWVGFKLGQGLIRQMLWKKQAMWSEGQLPCSDYNDKPWDLSWVWRKRRIFREWPIMKRGKSMGLKYRQGLLSQGPRRSNLEIRLQVRGLGNWSWDYGGFVITHNEMLLRMKCLGWKWWSDVRKDKVMKKQGSRTWEVRTWEWMFM